LKESVGFGAVVMRSVVRHVLWRRWLGSAWVARILDAAAGLGGNVAPARGWLGPQRRAAARLRAQGWRCLAARLFACAAANADAAARVAKVGPITVK